MLAQMTPEQFNERIAYEVVVNQPVEENTQPGEITTDDPDFVRKFIGFDPNGTAR